MEQHLHFIGIGGIGMSAIAKILLHQGFVISGSDMAESRLTKELEAAGAQIAYGHDAANVPVDCEAVVYSSAVTPENVEMQEAARRGLPVYKRAEMLAYLMSTKISIGVAGAHGKTTTSGMMATMLHVAEKDPTVIIGGMLPAIGGSNAKAGDGPHLVAEADESDGTFLLLHPDIAVVTNIEADHLDHYHDLRAIVDAFIEYLKQLPDYGFAVICKDCPICRQLIEKVPGRYLSYGLSEDADFSVRNVAHLPEDCGGVSGDVYWNNEFLGHLRLQVGGEHNIVNALAAVTLGFSMGLSFAQCAEGLFRFTGTGRRFEEMGRFGNLRVVDDYAHHPTEIKATIQTARAQGVKNLYTVFQPHRYSRTQAMYREFAEALQSSDTVMLVEVYPAFEKPIPGVSSRLVVESLENAGHARVRYAADVDEALQMLQTELAEEDMLLIMGAGNVRRLSERFAAWKKEETV